MTATIINFTSYRDSRMRGKRSRTEALGTTPLEQEPDSNGASSAAAELRQAYDSMKEALKERDRLILELDKR